MGRLHSNNLATTYPTLGRCIAKKNLGGTPLLQKDYGATMDCTITSLAFLFGVTSYERIEKIARRYGYDGIVSDVNPFKIKSIMQECCNEFNTKKRNCHVLYGKSVCYNYAKIVQIINKGNYVILNMLSDGRNYYENHTVTIVGYEQYEHGRMLMVYDNWNNGVSYVDYNKLCVISSINWVD